MSEQTAERQTQRRVPPTMRAVLADNHNDEHGLAPLNDLVDRIIRENGSTGLRDVALAPSLALATLSSGSLRIKDSRRMAWWTCGSPNDDSGRVRRAFTPTG